MIDKIQSSLISQLMESMTTKTESGSESSNSLTNNLFKGLNIDQFGLSDDAQQKVVWARSQFEVSYQVLKSVNSSQGLETSEETFSFKGSIEFLQKVSGEDAAETITDETTTEQDILSKLQDYFSPEKTAQRILDVATSFFAASEVGQTEGNTESARRKFADFIGAAIDEGFKQAKNLLGDLPDKVAAGIETTHSTVFSGLEDFVKNGISTEKTQEGGVMDKILAYRMEITIKSDTITRTSTSTGYNAKGEAQNNSASKSKITIA